MEVVSTSDSSSSVFSSRFQALYHSQHGALQESEHVFIHSGLANFLKSKPKKASILEIGFGTGLNALLTALYSKKVLFECQYTSIEAFPINDEVYHQLNYGELLNAQLLFDAIYEAAWDQPITITNEFILEKRRCKFEEFTTSDTYDIIYYDAFAPNTQPSLWEEDMMKKMYTFSKNGTILVTYCAKGEFRRTLERVGFTVERIPGPPGKRQMIRATCHK